MTPTRAFVALACSAAMLLTSTATAVAAKTCSDNDDYTLIKVTNVSCKKAKTVVNKYFENMDSKPSGFTCKQKQYPGGVTTTCRKGDNKKIVHQSAD